MHYFKRLPHAALFLALTLAGCSGGGGGGANPAPAPTPSLGPSATIDTTASTNRPASSIVFQTDGTATITQSNNNHSGTVSASITNQFFADLKANLPVSSYPTSTSNCAKSTSFGTTITITYAGSTTGDVSCPGTNTNTMTIYNDVQQIKSALNVS